MLSCAYPIVRLQNALGSGDSKYARPVDQSIVIAKEGLS